MKQISNPYQIVNVVSRRVRQLTSGHRALAKTDGLTSASDIALKEIAEGKITAEQVELETKEKKKKK